MSFERWLDKEDGVYMCSGILLGHKKGEMLPFATTGVDLESIVRGEISQMENDKNHMKLHSCGI